MVFQMAKNRLSGKGMCLIYKELSTPKTWRRDWDLNPGAPFGGYTLSRRAP